jgi:hypothetical protein
MSKVDNFMVLDSVYGKFILPKNYTPGPPTPDPVSAMLRTGRTHIEDEVQNILKLIENLPNNSIIVDAGANIGFFSIPVAQAVKDKGSKLISFEPQKQLFYALGGTIALNELKNVHLFNLGLGDTHTTATIPDVDYGSKSDYGMVAITEDTDDGSFLGYNSVQVIPLDSMELPGCDFFKIDVEGYEPQVLRGALETIKTYRPFIWIEYNMIGKDAITAELQSVENYEYHIIDWQNMLCAPSEKMKQ